MVLKNNRKLENSRMKLIQLLALAGSMTLAAGAYAHEGHHSGVSFEELKNGATVTSPFKVEMEVEGMKVHKAGDLIRGTGHFHIIIDGQCVKQGQAVAKDATHLHYGKGQSKTELSLASGKHTLSLQFADGHHISDGKKWCKNVHINVK